MLNIEEIKARLEAATKDYPAPWCNRYHRLEVGKDYDCSLGFERLLRVDIEYGFNIGDFVAHAPADIAALVEEVERLRAEKAEAEADYDRLTGLLRKRFPMTPEGVLPDWKIEDVLLENERLRAELAANTDREE